MVENKDTTLLQSDDASHFWHKFALNYMIIQAILGFLLFEYVWKVTEQYRKPNQNYHDKFPEYKRNDNPSKWSKLRFYPGALLVMPTRFVIIMICFLLGALVCYLCSLGHDFSKGPLTGMRKKIVLGSVKCLLTVITFTSGMKVQRKNVNFDYKEYLGQDYQIHMKKLPISTLVCNHVSWLDGHILLSKLNCAFAADAGFKNTPILGMCLKSMDAIFMPRAKSGKEKEASLLEIKKRQEDIQSNVKYAPLNIFPEGVTTNGTHLIGFKRGAFNFEKPVKPIVLKYTFTGFSTDYSIFDNFPLIILTLCWIWGGLKCEMKVMPEFQPNEYMFNKFADKGKERWQVYSWCVRDAMAQCGGLQTSDAPARAKIAYWKYLNGKINIEDFENKSVEEIIDAYNQIQAESKKEK